EPREACFASSAVRLSGSVAPWPGQLRRSTAFILERKHSIRIQPTERFYNNTRTAVIMRGKKILVLKNCSVALQTAQGSWGLCRVEKARRKMSRRRTNRWTRAAAKSSDK